MESSIVYCSGKKVASVAKVDICSVPVSEFIRPCGDSKKFFSEPGKFGKVNANLLTENPNVFEQYSGKSQSS